MHVFGSFARGALKPGDVDLDVEFEKDWRWSSGFADALSEGRDPYLRLRRHGIPIDPAAGRSERHAMLPQFEGLDRWLTRFHREHFVAAINSGAITVERLTLVEDYVDDPVVEEHLWHRWSSTSPLYRAASAVFAYLMNRGIDPQELHLHGRSVSPTRTANRPAATQTATRMRKTMT